MNSFGCKKTLSQFREQSVKYRQVFAHHGPTPLRFKHRRPIGIRLGDIAGNVLPPDVAHREVEVEVKFALMDRPRVGLGRCRAALGHRIGAIPAILRRIRLGRGDKRIAIGLARELPCRTVPLGSICGIACDRIGQPAQSTTNRARRRSAYH